jgi:hypothetical protein
MARIRRHLIIGALALGLAGCAGGTGMFGGAPGRPKSVVVTDFVAAAEVAAIDRGFSTRQEAKGGNFPILERRQRTLSRVNDEIVATIIATLREAGLDAAPGSEQGLSFSDNVVLVSGRLGPPDKIKPSQMREVGFGPGRGKVVADMTLTQISGGSKEKLATFAAEPGRKAGPTGKAAAARNAEIAEALVAEKTGPEKLSPDVEAQARRLGQAIGDKIVAFAKEKGWMAKPEGEEATPQATPQSTPQETVKLPEPKPAQKPAVKPAQKKTEKKPAAADQPADPDKPDAQNKD